MNFFSPFQVTKATPGGSFHRKWTLTLYSRDDKWVWKQHEADEKISWIKMRWWAEAFVEVFEIREDLGILIKELCACVKKVKVDGMHLLNRN